MSNKGADRVELLAVTECCSIITGSGFSFTHKGETADAC